MRDFLRQAAFLVLFRTMNHLQLVEYTQRVALNLRAFIVTRPLQGLDNARAVYDARQAQIITKEDNARAPPSTRSYVQIRTHMFIIRSTASYDN